MQEEPSSTSLDVADACRGLSALADGEADAADAERGLAAWAATDPLTRQRWHAYQLIGDVLRSEDLAQAPAHDAAFLQRLRGRLDREPAVRASQPPRVPMAAGKAWRTAWVMPVALAASVTGLATILAVTLWPATQPSGGPLLAGALATAPVVADAARVPAAVALEAAEAVPSGGRVVRDARLDRYLQAHRDYAAAWPGSLPGGAGRSISTVSLDR
jgi:sigma-E factor negative regulatory protein RseA